MKVRSDRQGYYYAVEWIYGRACDNDGNALISAIVRSKDLQVLKVWCSYGGDYSSQPWFREILTAGHILIRERKRRDDRDEPYAPAYCDRWRVCDDSDIQIHPSY